MRQNEADPDDEQEQASARTRDEGHGLSEDPVALDEIEVPKVPDEVIGDDAADHHAAHRIHERVAW